MTPAGSQREDWVSRGPASDLVPDSQSWRLLMGMLAGIGIGLLGANVMPMIVGSLIDDLSLTTSQAGLLGSVELLGVALASLAVAPVLGRWSCRRVGTAGVAIAAAGNIAAIWAADFPTLMTLRLLAGLGAGLAFAAGSAAVARSESPDRTFAQVAVLGGVLGAGVLACLPVATTALGASGVFATLAGVALVALPCACWLPDRPTGAGVRRSHADQKPVLSRVFFAALLAVFVASYAQSAIWAFAERIGIASGLSQDAVGGVLAGTSLIGLVGAGSAALVGTRWGRGGPLTVGIGGASIAALILALSSSPMVFSLASLAWGLCYFFALPYLMGVMAGLDPVGRGTAAAAGASSLGKAVGPLFAGFAVATGQYSALAWLAAVTGLFALLLLAPALQMVSKVETGWGPTLEGELR